MSRRLVHKLTSTTVAHPHAQQYSLRASVSKAVATANRTTASQLKVQSYHTSALQAAGGMTPPLPPFARSPPRAEALIENSDAVWDDGVAPELALDFDAPHISTGEALATILTAFAAFGVIMLGISLTTDVNGPCTDNPALPHATDCVDKDYSNKTDE